MVTNLKHCLHYDKIAPTWDEGLPLGNGILGSLIWGDGNPLNISLDRTDLWDLRSVPEFHLSEYSYATTRRWHEEERFDDLKRLLEKSYDRPAPTKIPAGRIEIETGSIKTSSLDITQALATVEFGGSSKAEIFLHAARPVGVLRLRDLSDAKFHLRAPAFAGEVQNAAAGGIGAGDLSQLGYPPPLESSGEGFCAFRQQGWDTFQFAVNLAWREKNDELLAVWSIASSYEGDDVSGIARRRAETALEESYDALFKTHCEWWEKFWAQSSLSLPDKQLERQWFLENYKFGAAVRRDTPPITLQGPWTADNGELPPWHGDYHHDLNTQLSYWPCYSGNHLDEGLGFLDWLWETRDNCMEWTRLFFDMPGINVPMTADLNNNQMGGWRQYTHSSTTAAWLAHHFYLHWRYSADREFLRARAYPYLRDCAVFLEAITNETDAYGLRTLPLSSSPEIHDNKPQAWFSSITNYDLSLIRWLFGATAELAEELQETEDATHWREVLSEMPDFALGEDGHLLVARGEPLTESHRHFSHLMAIHPLGLISPDDEEGRLIVAASLSQLDLLGTSKWCGYSFAWLGNMAARVGDGERAADALKTFLCFTLPNSFHANGDQSGQGHSDFTYRPFTLEGNFAFAAGVQEMLLQSWGGVLRIFPAIPATWRDVSFENLRGEGAFLVSAEIKNGNVIRVKIHAEYDSICRVLLPGESCVQAMALQSGEIWDIQNSWSAS
ncbi:MAG: glycoside hydrolase N-terminal domain-containing protein [Abditibacteriaceae bacterium]